MRAATTTIVAELLREIDATARLADFTETPDGFWYSIRVETPGDAGKALVLPKVLVLRAQADPTTRRTLTTILRAEVITRPSRDAMQPAREIAAGARSERDPPRLLEADPIG